MAICDIDYFKKVNDDYGHIAGDEVLKGVATVIRKRLRETDFVARFGGEEFVVLLPESDREQALNVMEEVRLAIGTSFFPWETVKITVCTSVGIANFKGKDNLESVFTRADKAFYKAKEAGRNQCRLAKE